MSRRRKKKSRRPRDNRGARKNGDRRPRSSRSGPNSRGATASNRTKLISRSCVFVGSEDAVTTFEVVHPATLGRRRGGSAPPDPTIIKGCPSRYALENCQSLQMGTLPYYRKKGDSLIWDLGEGVITGDERTEDRRDDPADLDAYKHTNTELSAGHPIERATGLKTIKHLTVHELSQTSLLLGDNCLIWCASLRPQTAKEWSLWRDSMASHYDHTTFLGEPAPFARILGLMASSKRKALGSYVDFRHPQTGHVEQCNNLGVFYGPVVYLDDPRDYILGAQDELDSIVRSVFTKTTEHRHQREYRFAILTRQALDSEIALLIVPPLLKQVLKARGPSRAMGLQLVERGFPLSLPSPRLLQCFAGKAPQGSAVCGHGLSLNVDMRARLHLKGTHHKSSITKKVAVTTVATADCEAIEAAIRAEPRVPNDSRIAKLTIDGGPGTITRMYCLEGIRGEIKYEAVSGRATLRNRGTYAEEEAQILCDQSGFDGKFQLSHSAQQLILTVVPMNPAATVNVDHPHRNPELSPNHIILSPIEDTHVTVTATSKDKTEASTFKIVIDRALCPASESKTEAP